MGDIPSESQPGSPGSPARLERDIQVLEEWARESGNVELADNVDRLAGDAELVMDMALETYSGPVWEKFANEMAKYALAVLCSWMGTDRIYKECASKGRPVRRLGRNFTQDEIEGLADETVAEALHFFRSEVLIPKKWNSTRGATLRTYFITQCLFRFANIYRLWLAKLDREAPPTDDVEAFLKQADMTPGPERHVIPGLTAAAAIASVKTLRVRVAMRMTAEGWSQADIAAHLGVTEKTVERMLANERDRLRRRGIA